MNKPSIFDFDDPISFIQEFYDWRLSKEPNFSLSQWSIEMGMRSYTPLKELLRGKRKFKKKHFSFLKKGLKMSETENLYFLALLGLSESASDDEKALYYHTINSIEEPKPHESHIHNNSEVFCSHLNMTILSLCTIRGPVWTPREILNALRFNQSLSIQDINNALDLLLREKLIREDKKYGYINIYDSIKSPPNVTVSDSHRYYQEVSMLAHEAATEKLSEAKQFQCFSIPLANKDLKKVGSLLRKLRQDIDQVSGNGEGADQCFQVNLQLFSTSNRLCLQNSDGLTKPQEQ